MTGITEQRPTPGADAPATGRISPGARADLKTIAYWLSLGAAAGGLGGALIGGIGGRLAMLLLRFTSDHSVRGVETDDGFIMGRFSFFDTVQLVVVTVIMGAVVGLIVVAGRPFFPKRGMPFAWALAGAITGGAILISPDGVDFTLLEPHWLAVSLFIAIPAIGAGLIAWLTELYPRFWWRKRKLTALAALAAVPTIIIFPVAIFAGLVGFIWFVAMQWPAARSMPAWQPARIAALAVFGIIVLLGLLDLSSDVRAIV